MYFLKRMAFAIPLLLIISALAFFLVHAAPGGPLAIYLSNPNVRPQDIERSQRFDRALESLATTILADDDVKLTVRRGGERFQAAAADPNR